MGRGEQKIWRRGRFIINDAIMTRRHNLGRRVNGMKTLRQGMCACETFAHIPCVQKSSIAVRRSQVVCVDRFMWAIISQSPVFPRQQVIFIFPRSGWLAGEVILIHFVWTSLCLCWTVTSNTRLSSPRLASGSKLLPWISSLIFSFG